MTTYGYKLDLDETEFHIVETALQLLADKNREESQDKPGGMDALQQFLVTEILAKLRESAYLTSTSSPCWGGRKPRPRPEPNNGAIFSECGNYRYKLWRIWDTTLPVVTFIGLNPSTADASVDDQTVRRCTGLTKKWGYGGFQIVNLFAYRSTDPKGLREVNDPIGPENDLFINEATSLKAAVVIAAWGEVGSKSERSGEVLQMIDRRVDCLGYTKDGYPRHPSRVSGEVVPVPFPPRDLVDGVAHTPSSTP